MIDSSGQSSSRSAEQSDPIEKLLGGFAEAWGRGLQAWQAAAGMDDLGQSDPFAVRSALMGRMEAVAKAFDADRRRDSSGGAENPGAELAGMSPALAEAWMAGAASAVRYSSALAALGVRYEASLVQLVADRATGQSARPLAEQRALADELRAFLRGVGDAASQEARLLQQDLERIGETIAQAADRATPSPYPLQYRRRHEVKP
jgi:hypothetical protein